MVNLCHYTANNVVEKVKTIPLFPEARFSSETRLGLAQIHIFSEVQSF